LQGREKEKPLLPQKGKIGSSAGDERKEGEGENPIMVIMSKTWGEKQH